MGTKNNPGAFDCYAKAAPDEPIFVLLGRDPLAPLAVAAWIDAARRAGVDKAKLEEARKCRQDMLLWRPT